MAKIKVVLKLYVHDTPPVYKEHYLDLQYDEEVDECEVNVLAKLLESVEVGVMSFATFSDVVEALGHEVELTDEAIDYIERYGL